MNKFQCSELLIATNLIQCNFDDLFNFPNLFNTTNLIQCVSAVFYTDNTDVLWCLQSGIGIPNAEAEIVNEGVSFFT